MQRDGFEDSILAVGVLEMLNGSAVLPSFKNSIIVQLLPYQLRPSFNNLDKKEDTAPARSSSLAMEIHPILYLYSILQWVLDKILSPTPPPPHAHLTRPRIAVIGAGLTGVSAASHCVGHGFDVTIFEAGSETNLGGIWSVRSGVHGQNDKLTIFAEGE